MITLSASSPAAIPLAFSLLAEHIVCAILIYFEASGMQEVGKTEVL